MQFDLFHAPMRFESVGEVVDALERLADDPLAGAGTNIVVYRGSPDAPLVIVGEAPGAEEDAQGIPFVGPSGKLLDKILSAAGFDTESDVFITNAAFRRPPGNRRPTAQEVDYYRPYLLELIRLVDPRVLMLAGAAAVEALLEESKPMSQLRGRWHDWNDRLVMPVYHPAYLLRNPSREPGSPKSLMWDDVREVRRKLVELGGLAPQDERPPDRPPGDVKGAS